MSLRVMILGAGLMGRWHAWAATRNTADVVGVYDRDEGAARALASRRVAGKACIAGDDLARMLEELRPECVHVCAPLAAHVALCHQALDAGAHVLVEKPIAEDASKILDILDHADRVDRVVAPVHQLAHQRWRSRLDDLGPVLGEIVRLEYAACSAGAEGHTGSAADEIVDDVLPHPLSLFDGLRPGCLDEAHFTTLRSRHGELSAQAEAEELALSISISMNGRPPRHELRVTGEKGTLVVDLFNGFGWHEAGSPSRAYKVARPLWAPMRWGGAGAINLMGRVWRRDWAYPGLTELVGRFYAHALDRESAPPVFPEGHALRVANARDAICGRPSLESSGE